ncbi:hypothetical protein [Gilliamella sp. Nev5-1]|nr:hypothetical protein [Gilliamella apicola]
MVSCTLYGRQIETRNIVLGGICASAIGNAIGLSALSGGVMPPLF